MARAKLVVWRARPNFLPGMPLAELATQWLIMGNSRHKWPELMTWLRDRTPGAFGTINHSKHFLNGFLVALVGTAHTCISSSIHSIVPATGLPSMLSRIIDVVSIQGRSLLPVIYLYTNARGELAWALIGMPCLEYRPEKTAIGVPNPACATFFGFHKAAQKFSQCIM